MPRHLAWMLLVPALATVAAPAPGDEPGKDLGIWGKAVDPAGDCLVGLEGDKLKVEVPGSKHDLSVEAKDMNAPRVLRAIEGDFVAQVKVSGDLINNANGATTSGRYLPYHGAGLLIWLDERTYVRFERAVVFRPGGEVIHYGNFAFRKDGKVVDGHDLRYPAGDTYVRLERRGGRVFAMLSGDGVSWSSLTPIPVDLPAKVQLGVVAVNTSTDPLRVEFSGLEVYTAEPRAAAP